jgi:hypothetical protein
MYGAGAGKREKERLNSIFKKKNFSFKKNSPFAYSTFMARVARVTRSLFIFYILF